MSPFISLRRRIASPLAQHGEMKAARSSRKAWHGQMRCLILEKYWQCWDIMLFRQVEELVQGQYLKIICSFLPKQPRRVQATQWPSLDGSLSEEEIWQDA